MIKKQDSTKLQFFSVSTAERLENEINNVVSLLHCGRISYEQARFKLQDAQRDMQTIYYDSGSSIIKALDVVSTMQKYGKLPLSSAVMNNPEPLPTKIVGDSWSAFKSDMKEFFGKRVTPEEMNIKRISGAEHLDRIRAVTDSIPVSEVIETREPEKP